MSNVAKIEIDEKAMGELVKSLQDLSKRFPYTAEKEMKKETAQIKKRIQSSYNASINKSKQKNAKYLKEKAAKAKAERQSGVLLERSFSVGKVRISKSGLTSAVTSRAPHYHLVEYGHEASGWYKYMKGAKDVEGKYITAKVMERENKEVEKIAQNIIDGIMKEVGLD